ncbi:MAG: T9SS type A sorting domain-containing protein [FCB group bacterium]
MFSNIDTKFLTLLFFIFLIFISGKSNLFSQNNNYNITDYSQYYDVQPDIANCNAGTLKMSEKQAVLTYINQIRAIHGLKPVTYNIADDNLTSAAALIMAANATLTHTPSSSMYCYTDNGNTGAGKSNLYIAMGSDASMAGPSTDAVTDWMIDNNTVVLGHRRAIINPFLATISFGRVDGTPKTGGQWPYNWAAALKVFNATHQDLSDWNMDYVAYPYGNYPTDLFLKGWMLSFSAFPDKQNYANDQKVDYSKTTVEMKDANNNPVIVSGITTNNDGWGEVFNCLSWQANIADNITYTVTIKNVVYNGNSKDYTYTFTLKAATPQIPDVPVQYIPANGSTNVGLSSNIQWNPAQRANNYHLIISKSATLSPSVLDNSNITNYSYPLSSLESNTKYYWKVAADNGGGESGWSPVWSFTTGEALPDIPQLVSPLVGEITNATPTFNWTAASNALNYNLQISTSTGFEADMITFTKTDISGTSFQIPAGILASNTQYYWRVQSVNNAGNSDWSTMRRFHTAELVMPDVPLVVSPVQGITTSTTPDLMWYAAANATSYNLEISNSSGFESGATVYAKTDIPDTVYHVPAGNLSPDIQYYWHIQSSNIAGASGWSSPGRFKTNTTPVIEVQDNTNTNLLSIYPNPFSNSTNIIFKVLKSGNVTLKIFNTLGVQVATISNERLEAGTYNTEFNSIGLSTGMYYIQMLSSGRNIIAPLEVVK